MTLKPRRDLFFLVYLLLTSSLPLTFAQQPPLREFQLKAVYLFNFTRFVKWPADTFSNADSPFQICIAGDDPFGDNLTFAIQNETYDTRPITIRHLDDSDDLSSCQLLYINQALPPRLEQQWLLAQDNQPILTVSSRADFAKRGGMVEFYTRKNRVRFVINLFSVKEANLAVNANLLRVADVLK